MWAYPEIRTLADIVPYHARRRPQATALISGHGRLSFAEFEERTNRVAQSILDADLPAGSRIGYFAHNRIELAELLFGAAKAGHPFMPLNWRLAPAEIAALIRDSGCALLFVEEAMRGAIDMALADNPAPPRIVAFSPSREPWLAGFADGYAGDRPVVAVPESATALQMYTSGTTGLPKGVELSHHAFNMMRLCDHLDPSAVWREGETFLMFMPSFHMTGIGWLIQNLYFGMTISMLPQFEPAAVLQAIRDTRPELVIIVPTALQMLLDHPDAATTDFSSIHSIVYAGAPMSLPLIRQALERMRCGFFNMYGATELTSAVLWLRPHQHDLSNPERLKSVGTPIPLVEVKLLDPQGQEVPQGSVGEIVVRMPSVFSGYWGKPAETAAVLRNGWYYTGDAAYRDADGYFFLKDRIKDMIVSGGENIYASEVEQALVQHPAVQEPIVIGVPHPRWGEAVKALVILRPGMTATPDELIAFCRTLIAAYKVPKLVEFVETVPRTPSGKVQKAVLRRQEADRAAASA